MRLCYARAAGAIGLVLSGCTVGPDYTGAPPAVIPAAYKEAAGAATVPGDGVWQPAHPGDAKERGRWWEIFGDPDLNALEERVDRSNQTLKVADARFRQARALIGVPQSALYPTLSFTPSATYLKASGHQPGALVPNPKPTSEFELPFDLAYEIDFWGRIRRGVTAARDEAEASAADLATAKLALEAELAIDYIELRSADAQQKLLNDTVVTFTDALQLTQDRLNGGAASDADVAQAKAQLETTRVQATDVAVARAAFEHAIAVLVGDPPANFSVPPSPREFTPPPVPPGLPSALLERRPDIAAAERRVAEANEQIGIAEAAFYPTVTLSGTAGLVSTSLGNLFEGPSLAWAVGSELSQILFDGGLRRAQSEASVANYEALVAQYRQTTLTAFEEVEDNLAALTILAREALQQKDAVDAAANSLRIFTNRYVGGVDAYLQVVTAQSVLLANQRNTVDIVRRRMEADILLVKAIGGGWTITQIPVLTETNPPPSPQPSPACGRGCRAERGG
ncbi:MAG TPA: efflux transporter outer membrane subunit [Stellaceae bacterium]|nr:efflux transporter outer membrane subunit [Stellaceae bacterium]